MYELDSDIVIIFSQLKLKIWSVINNVPNSHVMPVGY